MNIRPELLDSEAKALGEAFAGRGVGEDMSLSRDSRSFPRITSFYEGVPGKEFYRGSLADEPRKVRSLICKLLARLGGGKELGERVDVREVSDDEGIVVAINVAGSVEEGTVWQNSFRIIRDEKFLDFIEDWNYYQMVAKDTPDEEMPGYDEWIIDRIHSAKPRALCPGYFYWRE